MERVKKPRRAKVSSPEQDSTLSVAEVVADTTQVVSAVTVDAAVPTVNAVQPPAPPSVRGPKPQPAYDDEDCEGLEAGPHVPRGQALSVTLTHQLHCRLARMAQEEGVELEALVQELLAEGATLRAWEIIERKQAMRGGVQAPAPAPPGNRNFNSNYGNANGNSRHHNGNGRGSPQGNGNGRNQPNHRNLGNGGNRPAPNNAWMEDKAAFLEYVRNQEKQRRR